MPHRLKFKDASVQNLEAASNLVREAFRSSTGKTKADMVARAHFKRFLISALRDLKRNEPIYGFGPQQLIMIQRLKRIIAKARTPADFDEFNRLTCNLKLSKR